MGKLSSSSGHGGNPGEQPVFFDGLARLVEYSHHVDDRGRLGTFDFNDLPFVPCRTFFINNVPVGAIRGGHQHRFGAQMLVCLHGRVEVLMRLGNIEEYVVLEPQSPGLLFESGVWCQQRYLDKDSILLVFASEPYNPDSYVCGWDQYEADTGENSSHPGGK